MSARVLIVDDDPALAQTVADGLADIGYDTVAVSSSAEAQSRMAEPFDAMVTDLRMPEVDGMELLALSLRAAPERPVILMTAYGAVDTAVAAIRRGAYHYVTKPFKVEELGLFVGRALDESRLRRETRALRRTVKETLSLENVIGSTASMRDVFTLVRRVCDADVPVLVLGETGTGKGMIARALHAEGLRAERAFVTVNCASLPEALLESELFGHAKGAFTGATGDRRGLIEEAAGGTLFLDEIGEMPMAMQAKLLDVLERRVVRAVGTNRERAVDVRVVAATHRDLGARVKAGQFREDLLFRLDVVSVEIPPLRQRKDDIPALAAHFMARARAKHGRSPVERVGKEALEAMAAYAWPGNVRELEHVLERAVLLGSSAEVGVGELPRGLLAPQAKGVEFSGAVVTLEEIARRYASWALDQMEGRKMATAEKLDIDRKTLARLLGGGGEG